MFKKRLLQLLKRCVAALLMVVLPAQAFAHNALPKDLGRLDNALVHPALAGDKNALEGNFGLGQSAGQNAVENNYLTTRDLERALDSLKQCTQGCEVIRKSLLRNEQQGGEQQTLGNLQDTCRANPQACASQVQDIGRALTELQKPETLALLGQRNVNALIARQVTDLGQAVEALQWGAANEPTSRLIMQTALVVGTTAVGGGVMLSVGRALMTACAGGPLAPGCVAASTELAVAGMEAAGGVPTVGMTAAGTTAMASRLAKSASSATDVAQVVRQAQLELAAARAGANGGVVVPNAFATNSGEAVFWSGKTNGVGGADAAGCIASACGGTTLEQLMANKGITLPAWDASNPATVAAWQNASKSFAQGASGDVNAVLGSTIRPGSVWETVELPALKANPNVTSITTIDPATGVKTIIWKRSTE
jgi:hypothetical protein